MVAKPNRYTRELALEGEARRDRIIDLMGRGVSRREAAEMVGVTSRTTENYVNNFPDFLRRLKIAERGAKQEAKDGFPPFLIWRERHCAYFNEVERRWVRARNSWFQEDAIEQLEQHLRLVMVLPPGHIKTTLFGIERSVYDIQRDRNTRLTVVQKNEGEAAKLVRAVKERLGSHDYYHNIIEQMTTQGDFPIECPLCAHEDGVPYKPTRTEEGGKWGAFSFVVAGRTSGEKDATMEAKGVGSQIQGIRAARIVLDDIQDPQQAMISLKDSTDKLEFLRAVILGRLFPHQQLVILANFFTSDDFAHQVISAQPDWPVVNYPAILHFDPRSGKEFDPPRVLSPETWDIEGLLAKRKEVGESRWHFTWMQEAGEFDDQVFKRPVLDASRSEDLEIGVIPPQVTHVFVGCDPAIVGSTAIVVWGLDIRSSQRYLIDVFDQPGMRTFTAIQNKLLDYARTYLPRSCAIELANNQESITNDEWFSKEMRALGTRLVSYRTRTGMGARAEHDNFDISTIGGLFDAEKITLCYHGTPEQRAKVDAYIDELCNWRVDANGNSIKHLKRDRVMATLFAESEAFPVAQKGQQVPKPYKPQVPNWARNRWSRTRFKDRANAALTRAV